MAGTNKTFFLVLFLFIFSGVLSAQDKKYIVYFKNKNNTPFSISDPSQYLSAKAIERRTKQNIAITGTDLPVTPDYLDSLTAKGAQVLYSLKWLNAAAVVADSLEMVDINTLTFVQNYDRVAREMNSRNLNQTAGTTTAYTKKSTAGYGNSHNQIHLLEADDMHLEGYH